MSIPGNDEFFRKLIPQAVSVLLALTEAIKQNPAAKVLKLSPGEKEVFVAVKDILTKVSVLTHPNPEAAEYHLVTNSSNYAVGAPLHQIINGDPVPISFYSKTLSENQRKYSTFDRELFSSIPGSPALQVTN